MATDETQKKIIEKIIPHGMEFNNSSPSDDKMRWQEIISEHLKSKRIQNIITKDITIYEKVKQIIWGARAWEDIVVAIHLQYGHVVPLFHATSEDCAKGIDKIGLKFPDCLMSCFLYFQIGHSDFYDSDHNVLYRYDAPIELMAQYSKQDVPALYWDVEEVSEAIGRDILDRDNEVEDYETEEFIRGFFENSDVLDGMMITLQNDFGEYPSVIWPVKIENEDALLNQTNGDFKS